MVVFGQSGCILAKWLFSDKVVVFGQSGCIRANLLYLRKSGCNQEKMVVLERKMF